MAKKRKSTGRGRITAEVFNPDYTEIKNDLKNIGLLAGIFLAILIALSFIL